MSSNGIYVERHIHGSVEDLWSLTQTPDVHQRWDLRFTSIDYLPRPTLDQPRRFLYITRLLPGLAIVGAGESVGERHGPNGEASSALKFGSDQSWSLIRTGSGYWRYLPQLNPKSKATCFLTWYDYEVRFGLPGRLLDRLTLRPIMGWATAWSFDRLRLWVEQDQTPELSLLLAVTYTIARSAVAAVWIWHGLVPKLLAHDPSELAMLAQTGLPPAAVNLVGVAEVLFGLLLLVLWRQRWPLLATILAMAAALVAVALRSPQLLTAAFNPVTLNLSVIALSAIALLVAKRVPSARHCRRKPSKATP